MTITAVLILQIVTSFIWWVVSRPVGAVTITNTNDSTCTQVADTVQSFWAARVRVVHTTDAAKNILMYIYELLLSLYWEVRFITARMGGEPTTPYTLGVVGSKSGVPLGVPPLYRNN